MSDVHMVLSSLNFSQIGGGALGDMWKAEERGRAIAIYSLAPLLGPVVGPICGAWLVIIRSGFIMT